MSVLIRMDLLNATNSLLLKAVMVCGSIVCVGGILVGGDRSPGAVPCTEEGEFVLRLG
jgi:hypothetical protein